MRSLDQANGPGRARSARDRPRVPPDGAYLTDGKALFHVERTLADGPGGELYVELEDCGTLELILCSGRSVAALELRRVEPLRPAAR